MPSDFASMGSSLSIRALLVPGPAAHPQAGQGASAGWRAPPRAGPARAGGHLLRAADGLPVEGPGRDRPRLGFHRAPPVSGVGAGRAVLPALAGGCLTKAPMSRSEVVGRNPTDRGKQGVKRSLLVDGKGVPLALVVGPANRNDHLLLADTLDGLVARRPPRSALVQHLCLDLGYDDAGSRHEAARRGYVAHIRGRSEEARGRQSGRKRARRWVVERTHAWLNRSRRLLVRWERKLANHAAFLHLACALICDRATGASASGGARR